MANHSKTVADIAKSASHAAEIEGITGFIYGCAKKEMYQSKGTSLFYNKHSYLSLTTALHSSVTLFIILLNTSVTSSSLNVLSALLKVIV